MDSYAVLQSTPPKSRSKTIFSPVVDENSLVSSKIFVSHSLYLKAPLQEKLMVNSQQLRGNI